MTDPCHSDTTAALESAFGDRWGIWVSDTGRWWASRRRALTATQAAAGCKPFIHADTTDELTGHLSDQARLDPRLRRPWERSGLLGSQMNHYHGDLGVSLRTPWMTRAMARYLLAEWRAAADVIDVAELLTSELATNAIRSECAQPAHGSYVPYITQALWHIPDLVVIEISDSSEKPPELQVADEESESGRGLLLVESVSREWGYYYPRQGWKTVYCVVGQRELPAREP